MRKHDRIDDQVEVHRETIYTILQQLETQRMTIEEIIMQQQRLNKVLEHLETQKTMLTETRQQVAHQQEMLNSIFQQTPEIHSPIPVKASSSILDKLDLDVEKLAKIGMYIFNLYANSNTSSDEKENETDIAE